MRKTKLKTLLLGLLCTFGISQAWAISGTGRINDPYLIANASDFSTFATNVKNSKSPAGDGGTHFRTVYGKLTADITATSLSALEKACVLDFNSHEITVDWSLKVQNTTDAIILMNGKISSRNNAGLDGEGGTDNAYPKGVVALYNMNVPGTAYADAHIYYILGSTVGTVNNDAVTNYNVDKSSTKYTGTVYRYTDITSTTYNIGSLADFKAFSYLVDCRDDVLTGKLTADVTITSDGSDLYLRKPCTVDLNGKTITNTPYIHNESGTIYLKNGTVSNIDGEGGADDAFPNSTLDLTDMTVTGYVFADGRKVVINSGNYCYIANEANTDRGSSTTYTGTVTLKGGFFKGDPNYNPRTKANQTGVAAATDYTLYSNGSTDYPYYVKPNQYDKIATNAEDMQGEMDNMQDGETLTVANDIMTSFIITNTKATNFTVDFNGHILSTASAIRSAFLQNAANSTITFIDSKGEGGVTNNYTAGGNGIDIESSLGNIVIKSGNYNNNCTNNAVITVGNSDGGTNCKATIYGGTFKNANTNYYPLDVWQATMNKSSKYTDRIEIFGGTIYYRDPALGDNCGNISTFGANGFVAEGYASTKDGDWYTVKEAATGVVTFHHNDFKGYDSSDNHNTCSFSNMTLTSSNANWFKSSSSEVTPAKNNVALTGSYKDCIKRFTNNEYAGEGVDWFTITCNTPSYSKVTYKIYTRTWVKRTGTWWEVRAAYFDFDTDHATYWDNRKNDPKGYTDMLTANCSANTSYKWSADNTTTVNGETVAAYKVHTSSDGGSVTSEVSTREVTLDNGSGSTFSSQNYYGAFSSSKTNNKGNGYSYLQMYYEATSVIFSKYITFDANGGTGSIDTKAVFSGEALPQSTMTRPGYTFGGWATTADGAKEYDDQATLTVDANSKGAMTLYAVWTPAITDAKGNVVSKEDWIKDHNSKPNDIAFAGKGADVEGANNVFVEQDETDSQNNPIYKAAKLVVTDGTAFSLPEALSGKTCKAATATYSRTTSSNWGTICLPYAVKSDDYVQYYELTKVDTDKGVMSFTAVGNVDANTPAVFCKKQGADAIAPTSTDVPVVTTGNETSTTGSWKLIGTLSGTKIQKTESDKYYIASNKFWNAKQASGEISVNAYRAYFQYTGIQAKASSFTIAIADGDSTTAIGTIDAEGNINVVTDGKYMQNGKVTIVKNGKKYNAAGAEH